MSNYRPTAVVGTLRADDPRPAILIRDSKERSDHRFIVLNPEDAISLADEITDLAEHLERNNK